MKINLKNIAGILSFILSFPAAGFAQGGTDISGQVLDSNGEPIIGASVIVPGSPSVGAISDLDGTFVLHLDTDENTVLEVSCIGFETKEIQYTGQKSLKVILEMSYNELDEVMVVAYGTQKKETLTGAISAVQTDELLASPNASVANSLAGKITGLSSVQSSGQPGAEDPTIYVRGVGSLTDAGATPLILVDGVERSFFQMDPNEIESITVLKDASATAVFGVRGANGVVLVTTRRGEEGKTTISVNSSVGFSTPTRLLETADSYTYATMYNEQERNDGRDPVFDDYTLERFRLGDNPMMYPSINWRDYIMKKASLQTQHNINISGGAERVRYFVSAGYLYQDGLVHTFGDKNIGYNYNRFNYRANLDVDVSRTTLLKVGIGGIMGNRHDPYFDWNELNNSQPFSSPGIIDGKLYLASERYRDIKLLDPLTKYYGTGYTQNMNNTMNIDLHLIQKLDFITKGLSVEVKGAYNSGYVLKKERKSSIEKYVVHFKSEIDGSGLSIGDPGFDETLVYQVDGTNSKPFYAEKTERSRDWYFEASLRYDRKFGNHNVGALLLYNQSKKYYPSQYVYIPTAYVGLVGRVTYDYKSKYLAEFNIGYNGSENFAPDRRFGTFPAFSAGWVISEEPFMKDQNAVSFLKLRASVGLVGNDNMSSNRFLYLPDAYEVDKSEEFKSGGINDGNKWGYNFGYQDKTLIKGAVENRLGNSNVTWETALKQNYGLDISFLDGRLRFSGDVFFENRNDILIARQTIPGMTALTSDLLPVVNMGQVKNGGYELDLKWNETLKNGFSYYIDVNMSYSKNKIIFQDEVEPNEPYLWRTGKQVNAVFGYVAEGFYSADDFVDGVGGTLKDGYAKPQRPVYPGDVKYKDLNGDMVIDSDDQMQIGFPKRPNYVFGLNLGLDYKGFFFSMNWAGAAERSVVFSDMFRKPFSGEGRGLMMFQVEDRWTPYNTEDAVYPRFSKDQLTHNALQSTIYVKDGSYLKLKNLTIGYNFKSNRIFKILGISQLGVKFTGYNLLTFDYIHIMDPESNPDWYNDTYPITRQFNFGVNITF